MPAAGGQVLLEDEEEDRVALGGEVRDILGDDGRRLGGPRFGINVGAWMEEYGTQYVLQGAFDGFGFICWRRSRDGRPTGQPMAARTLDELADWADHHEAQVGKRADSDLQAPG